MAMCPTYCAPPAVKGQQRCQQGGVGDYPAAAHAASAQRIQLYYPEEKCPQMTSDGNAGLRGAGVRLAFRHKLIAAHLALCGVLALGGV